METPCPAPLGRCTCLSRHPVRWERQGLARPDLQLVPISAWCHWALTTTLLINWACVCTTPWSPGLRPEGSEYHGCLPSALQSSLLKEIKGLSPVPYPSPSTMAAAEHQNRLWSLVWPRPGQPRRSPARGAQALYQPELRATASVAVRCLRPPGLSFLP